MTLGNHHILIVFLPTMGHIRPGLGLISKFVKEHPELIITCPIIAALRKEIKTELAMEFPDQSAAMQRVRFPCFGDIAAPVTITSGLAIVEGFRSFYAQISSQGPYVDSAGEHLTAISPPKVCLLDLFASEILRVIRETTATVPILGINFGSVAALIRRSCPKEFSGLGNIIENAEGLAKAAGKPVDQFLFDAYNCDEKGFINLPGLPTMFDYEFAPEPSKYLSPAHVSLMLRRYHKTFQDCDGLVLTSNSVYEPEPILFLGNFLASTNRPCYVLGLDGISSSESLECLAQEHTSVNIFLNQVLEQNGRESLIYVSFGSVFWPTNVEASWKILEIIVEKNIPLILSHNDKHVPMPERMRVLLQSSKNVLVTPWAPQKLILNHKATGWFLTHCGLNSVTESLAHGVPMIAWPIDTDQPVNAAHITLDLKVAYELLETRTGKGLKPLSRGAEPTGTIEAIEKEFRMVLANAFGEDGKAKRRNVEYYKEGLSQLWQVNGKSTSELNRFLRDYIY